MAIDSASPRSRRALLAAALGAGAASVASALGRPLAAKAADGDPMVVGGEYISTSVTKIDVGSTGAYALMGVGATGGGVYGGSTSGSGVLGSSTSNIGVAGYSDSGTAVWGGTASANRSAVAGQAYGDSTAVQGFSGSSPMVAAQARTGVYGYAAQDATAVGVRGESAAGAGLSGVATTGVGVLATATTGTALQVAGKARFSRSGKATVLMNRSYADITVTGGLTSRSVVHATLQTYRTGVAIAAVRLNYPTTGKARIYLTKVASTTGSTYVGWFVAEY